MQLVIKLTFFFSSAEVLYSLFMTWLYGIKVNSLINYFCTSYVALSLLLISNAGLTYHDT